MLTYLMQSPGPYCTRLSSVVLGDFAPTLAKLRLFFFFRKNNNKVSKSLDQAQWDSVLHLGPEDLPLLFMLQADHWRKDLLMTSLSCEKSDGFSLVHVLSPSSFHVPLGFPMMQEF